MRVTQRTGFDERGITLTELIVAMFVTLLVGVMTMTWVSAVTRQEQINEQDVAAVDELRVAKSRITKELRFASAALPALSSPPSSVAVWIDGDRSGGSPDPGEIVTWEIQSDGTLTRSTDTGDVEIHGTGLDVADSSLVLDADGNVAIRFVIRLEMNADFDRVIETTVNIRAGS